jgi:hypothetical protein
MQALGKPSTAKDTTSNGANLEPPADAGSQAQPSPVSSTDTFKSAMNDFLSILHSVDVRLKRQILALEEAGIINLKNISSDRAAMESGSKASQKASLEPNGIGNIGNLDVGWLNSRGSKVEKDMEVELWARAKDFLTDLASAKKAGQAASDMDVPMGD